MIPTSNQAFRVAVAGHEVPRGFSEAPLRSLRDAALATRHDGLPGQAGHLFVEYHVRWALVGAALAFALFGLGIAGLRVRTAITVGMAVPAYAVYITYFFELAYVPPSIFIDEPLTIVLVWLPNLLLILVGLAFLRTADTDSAFGPLPER